MDGIIHPILAGVSFKRLHLLPVSQCSLLNALILPDELLHALPALRFRLMMLLGFVPSEFQRFRERRRQCSFSEFAGIDDEGERFVFDFFLHGSLHHKKCSAPPKAGLPSGAETAFDDTPFAYAFRRLRISSMVPLISIRAMPISITPDAASCTPV